MDQAAIREQAENRRLQDRSLLLGTEEVNSYKGHHDHEVLNL